VRGLERSGAIQSTVGAPKLLTKTVWKNGRRPNNRLCRIAHQLGLGLLFNFFLRI
jgi:hypothetical protein